tara:strand:- start:5756 stop:5935 length:180 start_codon:yes stop_codon:yes gene_type:complete
MKKLNNIDKKFSRICELQLYLTTKIFEGRNNGYSPKLNDEDQPIRDELLKLRKELGIIK